MKKQIEIATDTDGTFISGHYTAPDSKKVLANKTAPETLVIMVHGFPGDSQSHNDLFGDLEFLFGDYGLHTLRFDCRGCGKSEGKEEGFNLSQAQEDLDMVMKWARSQKFEKFVFVGEGLGAYLCLKKINEDKDSGVKLLMLFWPVLDLADYCRRNFQPFDKDVSQPGEYLHETGHKISLGFLEQLSSTGKYLPRPGFPVPVLVQQGARDKIVPVEQLDLLKEAPPPTRRVDITTYQDGDHGLLDPRHRKMIFFHIGQFIEKYA